jgi:PTH1 family peptidyl-tRNA hydrolase
MYLLVGLGNPGSRYAGTRHNLGFEVVEVVARSLNVRFKPGRGGFLLARAEEQEEEILLAQPTTFMNDSGSAVAELVDRFSVPLDRLLIVCDDFQLPLGALRLRKSGSDGGHNGLYSIIYSLQSDQFSRLRVGIGSEDMPKDKSLMKEFVLEVFARNERAIVAESVHRASNACLSFVRNGIDATMNAFNQSASDDSSK